MSKPVSKKKREADAEKARLAWEAVPAKDKAWARRQVREALAKLRQEGVIE
jgi:hypothetical protein